MGHIPIRIEFRRTGGFAGVPLEAVITADELAEEHAAQVRGLLAAGEPEAPSHPVHGHGPADRFEYKLDLDDGQRHRAFAWGETQVPESARPLLSELSRIAKPSSR